MLRAARGFVAIAGTFLLAGCLMPVSGPNSLAIYSGITFNGPEYGRVNLTADTVKILSEFGPKSISGFFGDKRPPPEIKFGIGDVISVTIFEAAAGGLFIPI